MDGWMDARRETKRDRLAAQSAGPSQWPNINVAVVGRPARCAAATVSIH